jgi:hypothetical protein
VTCPVHLLDHAVHLVERLRIGRLVAQYAGGAGELVPQCGAQLPSRDTTSAWALSMPR